MSTLAELLTKEGNFVIEKQPDGNFIGRTFKFGRAVEVRDIDPQTVLVRLLTHD